jgi:16S rRNA (guanine966-N2)-methyltransferase
MRIIRGSLKGRRINPPGNLPVRPTTDFAKEGLFNVLENIIDLEGLSILDLFSGTGGMSYEFASRGAGRVTCVEQDSNCYLFISKTVKELNIEDKFRVVKNDVFRYIGFSKEKYDLIFADPPYQLKNLVLLPDLIFKYELLNTDGLFILEHPAEHDFSKHPAFSEKRNYGNVNFSFFK